MTPLRAVTGVVGNGDVPLNPLWPGPVSFPSCWASGKLRPYKVVVRRAAGEAWTQVGETVSLRADEHISCGPWPCTRAPALRRSLGCAPCRVISRQPGQALVSWRLVPGFQASRVQSHY